MIASRRTDLKLTLYLCFAVVVVIGVWLAGLLLSQLAVMEPVTAPVAQSLADNGEALRFVASGDAATSAESYASARLWVWFCIGANGAGVVMAGLWLRAAMSPPTPAARQAPAAASPRGSLIERAMLGRSGTGAIPMPPQLPAPGSRLAPGAAGARVAMQAAEPVAAAASATATPGSGDTSLRLARVARIIDNLAFQTTLLAVNAAVEAERGSRLPPHP